MIESESSHEAMPKSIPPAFRQVIESEGATWKSVGDLVSEQPGAGYIFSFPRDVDLTKYNLKLSDFPAHIDVEGNLTINQEHFFVISDYGYTVTGDVIVAGKWQHALPSESADDLYGYLTKELEESAAAIGGKVRKLLG